MHLGKIAKKIRIFLRDKADNNILLDDVQFTDEDLECALELTADEYNVTTPITTLTWGSMPQFLQIIGATRFLLYSEVFLQARNQVTLPTDRGDAMGLDDKAMLYTQLQQQLSAEWKLRTREYKNQMNAESIYDDIPSDYAYLSDRY